MAPASRENVFVIVLAAGRASRFGATKQLAEFDGQVLVRRAVETAAAVAGDRLALVVGHDWQAVTAACQPLPGFLLVNDGYQRGIGSSIGLAARTLRHAADAFVIVLADQPLITADHLRALIEAWSGSVDEIVATGFSGTLGVPALLPSGCFDDLASLDGDVGAKGLLADERFSVRSIGFTPAAVDIDRPEDLGRT